MVLSLKRSGNTHQLTCPILPVKGSLVIVVQRPITPLPLSETTRAQTRSSSTLCQRKTSGLTLNGLGRINQSIMAFGYCILGSQANTRSSILGNLGTARNTQTDFLVLIEDSIKTLNVSNGPVKYQDAIQATKVRLNLAVARGVLLLPARMIINTESIVGYNNNLRRSTDDMKLGVNNQVNQDTKKASLKLMEGGPSKVNPPNSHPSNPIHKQATEAQGIAKPKPQPAIQPAAPAKPPTPKTEFVDTHHANKAVVVVGVLALVGVIIYASS